MGRRNFTFPVLILHSTDLTDSSVTHSQTNEQTPAETAAWKAVLTQMAMLMVPDEFMAGSDEVECEVFENEVYTPVVGWGAGSWVTRLTYSDRKVGR